MLSVRSGALYRNQIGYEYRKIKKIIKPFRGYWKYGKPDFLIMELKSPFTLIEGFVQPACLSSKVPFIYTANAYRQTTDKLMFKSVISTVR